MKIMSNLLILTFPFFLLAGCRTSSVSDQYPKRSADYGNSRFFVISDIHFLAPALYDSGSAFQRHMLYKKGNLTEYGDSILADFKDEVLREKPDFIIVPGDLTNNGEKESHMVLSRYFSSLEAEGVDVYAIPGNHDIDNPYPLAFRGDKAIDTESLSAGEFLSLYRPFGYDEALSRDIYSLSYAVEVNEKTLLIGLDSCRYGSGPGYLHEETLTWLEETLSESRLRGLSVLLFMHHSLLEHYPGQDRDKGMRLINRKELLSLLMKYDVNVVFTGHYHSQDIAIQTQEGHSLFDVETGSLISWPFAYRDIICEGPDITLREGRLEAEFPEGNGWELSYERINRFARNFLYRYGVREEDRKKIADYVSRVLLNHYQGDETAEKEPRVPENLSLKGRMALVAGRKYYSGRLIDEGPQDREIRIDAKDGSWTPLY